MTVKELAEKCEEEKECALCGYQEECGRFYRFLDNTNPMKLLEFFKKELEKA